MVACFLPHLLTLDQQYNCTASSVEFVEMNNDNRNVFKEIVTGDESSCLMCTIQKQKSECNLVDSKENENAKIWSENNVDCIILC